MKLLPEGRGTPKKIRKELIALKDGKYTGNELVFDTQTGQLMVKSKEVNMPSPDAVVLDQITEDGFFLMIIYHNLSKIITNYNNHNER